MHNIYIKLSIFVQLAFCTLQSNSILLNTQGNGNILKPEYGLHYERLGNLYHGIDRYYIIIGIRIPTLFNGRTAHTNTTRRLNCSALRPPQSEYLSTDVPKKFNSASDIVWTDTIYRRLSWNNHQTMALISTYVCETLLPIYQEMVEYENKYIESAHYILQHDVQELFPREQSRKKRSFLAIASSLVGFALQGINTYTEYRKQKMMSRALEIMSTKNKELQTRVISLSNELGTVALMTAHSIKKLDKAIRNNNRTIYMLETKILEYQEQINGLQNMMKHNTHAIALLTLLSGKLFGLYQRQLSQYQEIMIAIDKLIDSLDLLGTGHLSHKLVPPSMMKDYLEIVQRELEHSEYTVILPEVEHYYKMPLVTHSFEKKNHIVVQIPVFVQKGNFHPMELYRVSAVPVPYNLGEPPTGHDEDRQYTQTRLNHSIVAFNTKGGATTMTEQELATCTVYNKMYFCESMMFRNYDDENLPCELAVVMNRDKIFLKNHCKFDYLYDHTPEPLILESDTQLLLAGVPTPWQIVCPENTRPPPVPYEGHAYAIIEKEDICQCSVQAGNYVSMQKLSTCDPQELYPSLKFPINIALKYTFDEDLDNWDTILKKPWEYEVPDPVIIQEQDPDIMQSGPSDHVLELEEVANMIQNKREAYETKADKALSMNDIDTWFEEDNLGFGLNFIGFFIAISAIIVLIAILGYTCMARTKMMGLNEKLGKVLSVSGMISRPQGTNGEIINLRNDQVTLGWQTLGILIVYAMCAIAILAIVYYLYKRIHQACTKAIISPEGKSRDISHLYLEILNTNISKTVCLYVGTRYGYPTSFHAYGRVRSYEVELAQHCTYDVISVNWKSLQPRYKGHSISMPSCITVPLTKKYTVREMLEDPLGNSYRLLAVSENMVHVVKRSLSIFDQVREKRELSASIASLAETPVKCHLSPMRSMEENATYMSMDEVKPMTSLNSRPRTDRVTVTQIEVPADAIATLPRQSRDAGRESDEELEASV